MKPNNNSPFSFINSDSIIDYEEVHHNVESLTDAKDPKFKENIYYLYDKQSDRFVYFYYNSNIFIFSSKGQIVNEPKIGDLIFFGNCDHIGIVENLDNDRVYTIEGNTSDKAKLIVNGG